MADTSHVLGSSGIAKKLVDLGDGTYADAVADVTPALSTESVLAAATGSAGGLGKLAVMAENEVVYVRCKTDPARDLEWRVKADKLHALQMYKARTVVDSVDIALDAIADTNVVVINGVTLTGKPNAAAAHAHDGYFRVDASGDDADAVVLAALINADYAVVTAGTSVAAVDKLLITTDEGLHTIVAKATSANYPNHQYLLNATQGTELASIVLAINHKNNVTCTTADATGDTVTINGLVFTGGADEALATRTWDADSGVAATAATSLAACINSATYGVPGLTAVVAGAVVSLTRNTQAATVSLTSSNGTRLAVEAAGGVPGVIAVATGCAGELTITPTWTTVLTVTAAGTRLTVTDIDIPGILATPGTAKVTLTPGTPAGVAGELASVIQASGTATRTTISQAATLAGLVKHGAPVAAIAINSTTAGTIYTQETKGWEYCYIGVTNTSGDASTMALVVGATKG